MRHKLPPYEEVTALITAITSDRDAMIRIENSRPYRKRRIRNSVKRIRTLRLALVKEIAELKMLRSMSEEPHAGQVHRLIDTYNVRLAELRNQKIHLDAARRVEKLLKMARELNSMGIDVREPVLTTSDEPGFDEIVS